MVRERRRKNYPEEYGLFNNSVADVILPMIHDYHRLFPWARNEL